MRKIVLEEGKKYGRLTIIKWEKKSEARATLDVLPDSELLAELRRRGYAGKIYKKIQVIV